MTNNEIVPGFDDTRNENLKIKLRCVDEVNKCLLVILSGYVDTYNSIAFQKQIHKAIDAGFTKFIFQCDSLNYVSSTGIGSFTAFLKIIKSHGGDMILSEMRPKVYDVFYLLGFSKYFNIRYSLDDSINYFKKDTAQGELSVFPAVVSCPICEKKLKAEKSGQFRCSECKSILSIDESGYALFS
ncbi:MAG: STAS domain-containing protein [Treponema sp.]|nr:STAS domain-containing protein [Treponema sp.]